MRTLTAAAALMLLAACLDEDERPVVDAAVPVQLSPLEQASLDVLFVIDNSGSMASEQQKLAREIPRMVAVLTSGDRWATREKDVPPGLDEKARRFTPVNSLHLGLISTNFGGIDDLPTNSQPAILSCAGEGDFGRLQNHTDIATQGVRAMSRVEFEGFDVGAVVLPPDPGCALGDLPLYQAFNAGDDPMSVSRAFSCAARLGVRGCPFEQPLESMWNALAPSGGKGELYEFINGQLGNGDRHNAGFLRPGAALAVVVLTDEDDCSITDEGKSLFSLSEEAAAEYGNLNLRCMQYANEPKFERGVARYRDGLLGLKRGYPNRVVFTTIAGLPLDARSRSFDALLADPAMQAKEDPTQPGFPVSVCTSAAGDDAYAGRRLIETAKLFPNALAESICADDYAPVIDAMVDKIAPLMGP